MKRIRMSGLLYENNDKDDQQKQQDHAVGKSQPSWLASRSILFS